MRLGKNHSLQHGEDNEDDWSILHISVLESKAEVNTYQCVVWVPYNPDTGTLQKNKITYWHYSWQ